MYAFLGFYYFLMCATHFCALPILVILSFKQKYKNSLKKRFFFPSPLPDGTFHWIHACSFGEVKSLQSVIAALENTLQKDEKILLTTTTQTGFMLANRLYGKCVIAYLPFESFIPLWLKYAKIMSFTLTEAELWLMPLFCVRKKGGKTLLINARISIHSFPRYRRFRFFYVRVFSQIQYIFCQNKEDKVRLKALGAKNIQILGNLKLTEIPQIHTYYTKPKQPLWVIASTHFKNHQSEESLILQEILKAFFLHNTQKPIPHFLFAPRHPERFLEVEKTLNAILNVHHLPSIAKTSLYGIQNALQHTFILLDSLGELNNLYNIAYGVILGGSFLPNIGGHNPIEPAYFQTKLISGTYIFNQKALFSCVENAILCDINHLSQYLQDNTLKNAKITQTLDISPIIQTIKESYVS